MKQIAFLVLVWLAAALPEPADAQSMGTAVVHPVLTINSDALFEQSDFGLRVSQEIAAAQSELTAENLEIQAELTEEEKSLADKRPTMAPADFRAVANAFDARVREIRRIQDNKALEVNVMLERERTAFITATRPVLGRMMSDLGAQVILEQRTVILSNSAIDVTRTAIERLNAEIGDGAGLIDKQ